MMLKSRQTGFTLIEIAIVLLIVTILLGYTVALFPRQQQLKQYRSLNLEMDRVVEAIIGFAQVNGRLPCPALPDSVGIEDYDTINTDGCDNYGGFVPVNTLGLNGRLNDDSLLLDPWGNPYRYYVTNVDFNANLLSDFTTPGEMRSVGLVDAEANIPPGDGYIDLDGHYLICDSAGSSTDDQCTDATEVFGRYTAAGGLGAEVRYGGAPFVLLSQGKNWNEVAATGDELENSGASLTTTDLGMGAGPTAMNYVLKNVVGGETTFVRRLSGFADDYDDVVRWASPSILFSRMIQAGQLP
jgi:prepilin-type N-terminal cleavage/methylation domain-containing protein